MAEAVKATPIGPGRDSTNTDQRTETPPAVNRASPILDATGSPQARTMGGDQPAAAARQAVEVGKESATHAADSLRQSTNAMGEAMKDSGHQMAGAVQASRAQVRDAMASSTESVAEGMTVGLHRAERGLDDMRSMARALNEATMPLLDGAVKVAAEAAAYMQRDVQLCSEAARGMSSRTRETGQTRRPSTLPFPMMGGMSFPSMMDPMAFMEPASHLARHRLQAFIDMVEKVTRIQSEAAREAAQRLHDLH